MAKQFDGFRIDGPDDIHINGKLVLGESIGDLAGLKIAYLAFKKTAQGTVEGQRSTASPPTSSSSSRGASSAAMKPAWKPRS